MSDERTHALRIAIRHIEHMAAWIAAQNAGYSFEGLGEDMSTIRAAASDEHRCNICGGLVRFDGTPPRPGMWGHR